MRKLSVLVVGLAALGLTSTPAEAVPMLDQQHTFVSGVALSTNGNVSEVGQTFTVGIAGTLDHIDVFMFRLGGIFDPATDPILSVYATVAGVPSGAALASVSVAEALVPLNLAGFVTFDVSAAAIAVNVGDVLAFGVSTALGVGPYFMPVDSDTGQASDYTAGDAAGRIANPPGAWSLNNPAEDISFKTFVDGPAVPEPSSVGLVFLGLVATRLRRSR